MKRNVGNAFQFEFSNVSANMNLKEAKNFKCNSIEVVQNLPWSILIQLAPDKGDIKFGVFLKLEMSTESWFAVDVEFELRILNRFDTLKSIKEGPNLSKILISSFFK